jgi:hypothetical protein
MRHIRQIMQNETDAYTVVNTEANAILEEHPSIVDKPEVFEIVDCDIPEIHQRINYVGVQVPDEVPLWRIRAILAIQGKETQINAAINSLPDPPKTAALYVWQYGTVIERNSATVQFIQSALEMTNAEVDAIFIEAVNINV